MHKCINIPKNDEFNRSYALKLDLTTTNCDSKKTLLIHERSEPTWYKGNKGIESYNFVIRYFVFQNYSQKRSGPYHLHASYNTNRNTVDLTCGGLFIDPVQLRGHGVGTFLFYRIIKWAKTWPSANVAPIMLTSLQAYEENKERRNHFYERFGIEFNYFDQAKMEGVSLPILASNLQFSNIDGNRQPDLSEISLDALISEHQKSLLTSNHRVKQIEFANTSLRTVLREIDASPLAYAIRSIFQRYATYLYVGMFTFVFICLWVLS